MNNRKDTDNQYKRAEVCLIQRHGQGTLWIMDIAKEQGMSIRQIHYHDVLSSSPLFDGDLGLSLLMPLMLW